VIPISAVEPWAVESMEPRAGADEDSVNEVVGAPISVRRTSIRIIRVVAISAYWRGTHISRTHSDSDSNANLRVSNATQRKS
jgi:hypothetical protein